MGKVCKVYSLIVSLFIVCVLLPETLINALKPAVEMGVPDKVEYSDEAFNYLAIGNSITIHGLCDYWWNHIGMAATTEKRDYLHLVVDDLKRLHGNVCYYAVNFFDWEQAHNRSETYKCSGQAKL